MNAVRRRWRVRLQAAGARGAHHRRALQEAEAKALKAEQSTLAKAIQAAQKQQKQAKADMLKWVLAFFKGEAWVVEVHARVSRACARA